MNVDFAILSCPVLSSLSDEFEFRVDKKVTEREEERRGGGEEGRKGRSKGGREGEGRETL
jgi:hypothetical protein